MDVDAPVSVSAELGGNCASAEHEDAHTEQSSGDSPTVESSADSSAADATPAPSGPTAAEGDARDRDRRAQFRKLAEIVEGCTEPFLAVKKWGFLEQSARLRIDMSPEEFVAALEQDYSAEALTELGLYERVDDELRLPSWLDGDAPLYVTIDADNRKLSFCRDSEFLFPMARTALDCALERNPPESTQAPITLFVVESQDSVEIMQRLGLRSVSCEGLETLGGDEVQQLFDGDHRSDFGWRYCLLLLDLDVARLANRPTAAIGEVIQRLADAADVYGIDPARRFAVCRPSANEFEVLERATTFEASAQICQLFEKWAAAAKSVRINSWRTHFNTEVASFSVASAALTRALQQSNDLARRAQVLVALSAYRDAGKRSVIQKFYEAIDSASDPFDQVDLIAAAGHAETFLDSDPLVRAGEAVLAGQTPPSPRELHEELFEQRQRCMVELRRIHRDRKAKRSTK